MVHGVREAAPLAATRGMPLAAIVVAASLRQKAIMLPSGLAAAACEASRKLFQRRSGGGGHSSVVTVDAPTDAAAFRGSDAALQIDTRRRREQEGLQSTANDLHRSPPRPQYVRLRGFCGRRGGVCGPCRRRRDSCGVLMSRTTPCARASRRRWPCWPRSMPTH